jgi:hypothetical protein
VAVVDGVPSCVHRIQKRQASYDIAVFFGKPKF